MLPRPLYESMPLGCLALGALVAGLGHAPLLWFAGGMLFGCGALLWVMRSSYRRTDLVIYPDKRWFQPEWFYELQPFMLLAAAVIIARLHELGPWLALLPALWALNCLRLRLHSRHHRREFAGEQLKRHRVPARRVCNRRTTNS
ncbi:hypothetical protein ATO46_03365 [Aeromonas schubertii]|uniref:hypothetical protein n=1 Tax=Aeromonas schubertii TaxID=652 RepID=UPI00067E7461|nr:hypothetical protein [Aeromonas schubertii]KUE80199.1 hypothetical protein ATO46_03365 [Aeromonas schubertii]